MIQGLRLLPFTADNPLFDCDTCLNGEKRDGKLVMLPQPIAARRKQACGFLPLDPSVRRVFGIPAGVTFPVGVGDGDSFVPLCPGYTTALPEVREAVALRPQWLKGTLALYLAGEGPDDVRGALDAQAILDGAITTKQNHEINERAKGANRG